MKVPEGVSDTVRRTYEKGRNKWFPKDNPKEKQLQEATKKAFPEKAGESRPIKTGVADESADTKRDMEKIRKEVFGA